MCPLTTRTTRRWWIAGILAAGLSTPAAGQLFNEPVGVGQEPTRQQAQQQRQQQRQRRLQRMPQRASRQPQQQQQRGQAAGNQLTEQQRRQVRQRAANPDANWREIGQEIDPDWRQRPYDYTLRHEGNVDAFESEEWWDLSYDFEEAYTDYDPAVYERWDYGPHFNPLAEDQWDYGWHTEGEEAAFEGIYGQGVYSTIADQGLYNGGVYERADTNRALDAYDYGAYYDPIEDEWEAGWYMTEQIGGVDYGDVQQRQWLRSDFAQQPDQPQVRQELPQTRYPRRFVDQPQQQQQRQQPQMRRPQQRQPVGGQTRSVDYQFNQSLEGRVVGLQRLRGAVGAPENVALTVEDDRGQRRTVVLGELAYVNSALPRFQPGDRVRVAGQWRNVRGSQMFQALELTSGNRRYNLPRYAYNQSVTGQLLGLRRVQVSDGAVDAAVATLRTPDGRTVDVLMGSLAELRDRGINIRPGSRVDLTGFRRSVNGSEQFIVQEASIEGRSARPQGR